MKKISEPIYQEGDDELLGGFVNAQKALQLLQCKTTTLYYLRKHGKIVSSKVGRKIFYEIKSIQDLLILNRSEKK